MPLHAQITQELRYRIATGSFERGSRLPSVRDAAERWDVHFHTVRRAYQDLERQGLAVRRGPLGTFVADKLPTDGDEANLAGFLEQTIDEAHRRFGISNEELGSLLANREAKPVRRVTVVECNRSQAAELAADLRRAYSVETTTRLLSNRRALPDGIIVSTLFHRRELVDGWPDRLGSMRFLRIVVSPIIVEQLQSLGPLPREISLFESNPGQGKGMANDIEAIMTGYRGRIRFRQLPSDGSIPASGLRAPVVLVSPRHWNRLPKLQRDRPGVLRVPYHFDRTDLAALATTLGESFELESALPSVASCPWAKVG